MYREEKMKLRIEKFIAAIVFQQEGEVIGSRCFVGEEGACNKDARQLDTRCSKKFSMQMYERVCGLFAIYLGENGLGIVSLW